MREHRFSYWIMLTPPPSVHKMKLLDVKTWIVPSRKIVSAESASEIQEKSHEKSSGNSTKERMFFTTSFSDNSTTSLANVIQKHTTFNEKIYLILVSILWRKCAEFLIFSHFFVT